MEKNMSLALNPDSSISKWVTLGKFLTPSNSVQT